MLAWIKKIFKRYFIAGILVTAPLILTFWILKGLIIYADNSLLGLVPQRFHPTQLFGFHIPGLGLIVTITLVLLIGLFARLYIGKKVIELGDALISRIPLGRTIYTAIQQFLKTVIREDEQRFQNVCLVEYPRRGCYMLAFMTGEPIPMIQQVEQRKWINLFIPTTPNPTSGFWIMVPEEDITVIDISIEYAFKLVISAGIAKEKKVATAMNERQKSQTA
ncbi:MAG: hypothetical protein COV43_06280 [Deltaproteobacteria bacterium CG11_big_fil_rev_8_21_14_0_20_42_23]|nr:MAG: hypothetical protein COV43_06280 [Deltaproteobacteria bacterium CG11_big_fil_rev_8_21_14_0_20_42_23]PJC64862.1 MAG: hypothetical protein CO021_02095 [Deltaproteobacteria bacterium CG_4_9_14_0_2_um_filter_42_21]